MSYVASCDTPGPAPGRLPGELARFAAVIAGSILVAAGAAGCRGEVDPGSGERARAQAEPARPQDPAAPRAQGEEKAGKAAFHPVEPPAELPPEGDWPGDGLPFPLTVEFVSAGTGELLSGEAAASILLSELHPKITGGTITFDPQAEEGMGRIRFASLTPSMYTFSLRRGAGGTRHAVECWVPVAPAENRLRIPLEFVTLVGRVLAPTGAPISGVCVSVNGQVADPGKALPRVVRLHSVRASTFTDDSGRFQFEDLSPGPYFVTARPVDRPGGGRWVPARIAQVIKVGPGQPEPEIRMREGP